MRTKKHLKLVIMACTFLGLIVGSYFFMTNSALAQDMFIYPQKGQSEQQMGKDKYECYTWAKRQTGFDPMEAPKATAPPPPQAKKGGMFKGAAGGALMGAAIGEIADNDPGKGAAIGAVAGGIFGGARRQKQQQQQQQQWADQQASQYAQKRNSYNRAHAACLEGRGYTVR